MCCTRRGGILSTKVAPAWEKQEPSGLIGPLPAGLRGAGSIHRCLGSAPSCGQGVLRSAPFDMPFLRAPAFPPGAPAPPDGCSAFPLGVLSAHGWAGCDAPRAFLPKKRRCSRLPNAACGRGQAVPQLSPTGTVPCFACCETICISMSPSKNSISGALFSSDCWRCQQRAENSFSCRSELTGCSE